jgi:hypothetical protein
MLRKNQPIKFKKPYSTMRTVLALIEQGHEYRHDIVDLSGLRVGQVSGAIYNLVYIGAVQRGTDEQGRTVYRSPGRHYGVAPCLRGVRSIFDVR